MTSPTFDNDGASRAQTPEDESYARYRAEDRSLGEIVSDVMDNASTLVKQEVELAKAEVKQQVTRAGTGAGLFAGAAVAALMMLFALTLALWWALSVAIGSQADPALGLGGLATAGIWLVIAAILALAGKSAFNKIKGLEQTTDTVSKIPNAATGHEEKNR
ncbi:phage holin family protein [Nigerium massiliense]|uniref:phage holin family protein n=1 Tax=Nigerium massiliense TaxID=1522317 RepID=UPI000590C8EB|nr:phage holin family protein [Nigerium massiliense]